MFSIQSTLTNALDMEKWILQKCLLENSGVRHRGKGIGQYTVKGLNGMLGEESVAYADSRK